jgi:hypothetical protein
MAVLRWWMMGLSTVWSSIGHERGEQYFLLMRRCRIGNKPGIEFNLRLAKAPVTPAISSA